MKNILSFVSCILIGIGLAVLLPKFSTSQNSNKILNNQVENSPSPFNPANPPTDTLKGDLTYSGAVKWQSREATKPATLTHVVPILQGEKVVTGKDGTAQVNFPQVLITLSKESEVDFSQTLSANLVLEQPKGSVVYKQTQTGGQILSIRSLHLLINPTAADLVVTTDSDNQQVFVNVRVGEVKVAYNDINNQTNVSTVSSGHKLSFDDKVREINIQP